MRSTLLDFSGLVKAVQDLWDFVRPPVLCLIILAGIAYYAAPRRCSSIWNWIWRSRPTPEVRETVTRATEHLGFDKLLPILMAFVTLLAFNVIWDTVTAIGNAFPPYASYSPDIWLIHHATEMDLQCLWAQYGDAPDMTRFQTEIERTTSEAREVHKESPRLENIDYWLKQEGKSHQAWLACKFFFLWAILCAVSELMFVKASLKIARRLFLCLVFLTVAGGTFLFSYIYGVEQVEVAQVSAAEAFLFPNSKSPCAALMGLHQRDFKDAVDESRKQAAEHLTKGWWTVSVFDSEYFTWVWNQEFKPHEGN